MKCTESDVPFSTRKALGRRVRVPPGAGIPRTRARSCAIRSRGVRSASCRLSHRRRDGLNCVRRARGVQTCEYKVREVLRTVPNRLGGEERPPRLASQIIPQWTPELRELAQGRPSRIDSKLAQIDGERTVDIVRRRARRYGTGSCGDAHFTRRSSRKPMKSSTECQTFSTRIASRRCVRVLPDSTSARSRLRSRARRCCRGRAAF